MSSESPKGGPPTPSERAAITVEQPSLHVSPLPSPADLAQYDHGAERIVRMAEGWAGHIQAGRGQTFALGIGLATLGSCLAAALSGHDAVGMALAASSLVGVVAAFLRNRVAAARSAAREDRP